MLIVALGWSLLEAIQNRLSTSWKTPSIENLQSTHSSKMYIHTIGGHSTNRKKKKKKGLSRYFSLGKSLSTGMIESEVTVVSWKILGCYLEPSLCIKGDISTFSDTLYSSWNMMFKCTCFNGRRDVVADHRLTCCLSHQQDAFCSVSLKTNLTMEGG